MRMWLCREDEEERQQEEVRKQREQQLTIYLQKIEQHINEQSKKCGVVEFQKYAQFYQALRQYFKLLCKDVKRLPIDNNYPLLLAQYLKDLVSVNALKQDVENYKTKYNNFSQQVETASERPLPFKYSNPAMIGLSIIIVMGMILVVASVFLFPVALMLPVAIPMMLERRRLSALKTYDQGHTLLGFFEKPSTLDKRENDLGEPLLFDYTQRQR